MKLVGGLLRYWVVALVVLGCGGPEVAYEAAEDFGTEGWAYADSVSFDYTVTDTSRQYDLVLTVDHTDDFAYENFYVQLNTYLPDGDRLTQALSLELADNYGQWYGECEGTDCTTAISLQEGTRFTAPGAYRLVVAQYSRDTVLAGVTGLGYRVVVVPEA